MIFAGCSVALFAGFVLFDADVWPDLADARLGVPAFEYRFGTTLLKLFFLPLLALGPPNSLLLLPRSWPAAHIVAKAKAPKTTAALRTVFIPDHAGATSLNPSSLSRLLASTSWRNVDVMPNSPVDLLNAPPPRIINRGSLVSRIEPLLPG